jgi:hypothetical protein
LFLYIRTYQKWIITQLILDIILGAGDQALRLFKNYYELILLHVWRYFQRIFESQINFHRIIMIIINNPIQSKFWRIESDFSISLVLWLHINLCITLIDPGSIYTCIHLLAEFNCYLTIHINFYWIYATIIYCLIILNNLKCIFAFYFVIL